MMLDKKITYALMCPVTNNIFYVGITSEHNFKNRMSKHLSDGKYKKDKVNLYINFLLIRNLKPIIIILEICSLNKSGKYLTDFEVKWIQYLENNGHVILNKVRYKKLTISNIEEQIKNILPDFLQNEKAIKSNGKLNRTLLQDMIQLNNKEYKLIQQYCNEHDI